MTTRILVLGAVAFISLNSAFADFSVPESTPSCVPPPSDLVSWWRAEGNANDSVGTNNGAPVGGVTYTNGEVGQAFFLNGTNAYIKVPASPDLNVGLGGGMTIEGWIKPSVIDTLRPMVEWNNGSAWGVHFWVSVPGPYGTGPGCLYINIQDANDPQPSGYRTLASAPGIVHANVYQHVAFTFNRTSGLATIYLNGAMVAQKNLGTNFTPLTSYDLYLGTRVNAHPPEIWAGSLDEFSLYRRALSSNEIAAIYSGGSAGKCPSPPPCVPPPSGLISWWPGEGNANDVVGTNNGTLVNGVTFTLGKVGQAFHLDGTNQYVEIADSPSLKPINVSVEAWVKLDTLVTPGANIPGQQVIVFKKNTRNGNFEGYTLLKDRVSGQDCFSFAIASAGGLQVHALSSTIPQVGTWYHLVGTYDGTTVRLYVNGVLEGSVYAGFPLDYGTRPVFFGRTGEFWVANFGGSIDEVSIYNRALAANEIQSLYDAGSAGKCSPPPLSLCVPPPSDMVSWWRAESNANDSLGANNGTTVGGVSFVQGEVGQAFYLNGTNAYVVVPASSSLNVGKGNGFTVEGWINPSVVDSMARPIVEWNNGSAWGVHLWDSQPLGAYGTGPGCLYLNIQDANSTGPASYHTMATPAGLVQANVYQHVAFTYDHTSGMGTIYLNGTVVAQRNLGNNFTVATAYNLYLGARVNNTPPVVWAGSLDEFSVYSRVLTANEITAIYNAGSTGKCIPLVSPMILVQPQGQAVNVGDTATFLVSAEGSLPLYYQWFFNSNTLVGATSPTLTLTNTQPDQGGIYSVVVSNAVGVTVSSNALLHVNQIPVADASATVARIIVCNCTDTNAAVVLNGTRSYDLDDDPLTYIWFEEGVNTPLATGAVAVVVLPPGTYPIALVVSDGMAADTNVVVVKVLTATQAVGGLIDLINGSDIAHQQPLIATLMAASDSIARCNSVAAVNQLEAFQNKVLAQVAPDNAALAEILIASAQEIVNSLDNCGGSQGRKNGKITAHQGKQNGKVRLEFEGNPGQSYIIEASSDMAHWEKIGVATDLQDGSFNFEDNDSKGAPIRFYRVVTP